jgi:toxin YoeB
MRVIFSEKAWEEYQEWQGEDKKTLVKINELVKSIQRDGFTKGIGKPKVLSHSKEYSRKIDDSNRLVYSGDKDRNLVITSCKGHYDDK